LEFDQRKIERAEHGRQSRCHCSIVQLSARR
jgi:hypothetical protein